MPDVKDFLFSPYTLGDLQLPNRVIMAPLTRSRAKQPGDIPWELNATYYAQRASAGLIIAEATQISPQGKGYSRFAHFESCFPGLCIQALINCHRKPE